MKLSDFKVGQAVVYVPSRMRTGRSAPENFVVKCVGRKWITAGEAGTEWQDRRFYPSTMNAEGGAGSLYLTIADYEAECDHNKARSDLLSEMQNHRSFDHLTATQLREITALLKGKQ